MKNQFQDGNTLEFTAAADAAGGEVVVVGDAFGVLVNPVKNGDKGVLHTTGVFILPRATGSATANGATLYWDATNKRVTTTSTSNTKIGKAWAAAVSGDTSIAVRLCQ